MEARYFLYISALFLAAVNGIVMLVYAQRHWKMAAARPFSFIVACVAWWGLFAGLSAVVPTEEGAFMMGTRFRFSGVVFISAAALLFALAYRGRTHWLNGPRLALILAIPFISFLLNLTSDFHQLFVYDVSYAKVGGIWLRSAWSQGPWFRFVYTPYSYLALLITIILLIIQARRSHYPYRQQSYLILAGVSVPILASIPATFGFFEGPDLDIIVLGFTFMGLTFGWALSRFQLLDIMPIARSTVLENMTDSLLILDNDDRVVELNNALYTWLGLTRRQAIGMKVENIFDRWPELVARYKLVEELETVVTFTENARTYYLDAHISPIRKNGRKVGRMVVWRDITKQKETELALETSLSRMAQLLFITESLTDFINLPDLFQTIVDRVARALPANRVSLIAFDQENETLTHYFAGGKGADKVRQVPYQELMQGLSGWVMQHGKPALSLKDELDQRESTAVRRRRQDTESGSIIVVPLLYRDRILGTLTAINSDDEPDFEKHDVNLMQAMASQAAVAIENTRLYTAEREQVQELKESNEALQAFSHMVAHDLKGPLSIIVGYAELITVYDQDRNFTKEEIFAYVQTMLATGHKMSTIINELLMLANIRRQEEMPLKPLKIGEVIDEVLLRMHWGVEKAQARIIKPEKWPAAVGYSPWVEENWVNYISNALKYGGERPTIILGYDENWPGDLDQIRFYVQDNGDGLTAEEQTHLFKEFSRVGQHKIRGHGLGLSIVRRITERMGGTVGVESQPGKGSIFYFTLPKEGQEEGLQNTIPDRIR